MSNVKTQFFIIFNNINCLKLFTEMVVIDVRWQNSAIEAKNEVNICIFNFFDKNFDEKNHFVFVFVNLTIFRTLVLQLSMNFHLS